MSSCMCLGHVKIGWLQVLVDFFRNNLKVSKVQENNLEALKLQENRPVDVVVPPSIKKIHIHKHPFSEAVKD